MVIIVYVLLGISLASICNMPTFRNHVSVPSSKAGSRLCGVRKGKAIYTVAGNGTGASQANVKCGTGSGRFRMGGRVWRGRYRRRVSGSSQVVA